MSDLNIVILCGRLAAPPEFQTFETGNRRVRLLITVRRDLPTRRIDVVPVVLWNPPVDLLEDPLEVGDRVWITGSVERRFWDGPDGPRSRLQVVACAVTRRADLEETTCSEGG